MFTGITCHTCESKQIPSISRLCLYFFSIWIFFLSVIIYGWEAFPFMWAMVSVGFHQKAKPLIPNGLTFDWLKRDRRQLLGSGGEFNVYWVNLYHDFKCYSQRSCIEATHFRRRPHFPNACQVIPGAMGHISWYFPPLHQYVQHF